MSVAHEIICKAFQAFATANRTSGHEYDEDKIFSYTQEFIMRVWEDNLTQACRAFFMNDILKEYIAAKRKEFAALAKTYGQGEKNDTKA